MVRLAREASAEIQARNGEHVVHGSGNNRGREVRVRIA